MQDYDSFMTEKSIKATMDPNKNCTGILIDKNNKNVNLESRSCGEKNQFLCSLDKFQYRPPVKLTKFPCVNPITSINTSEAVNERRSKRDNGKKEDEKIGTS